MRTVNSVELAVLDIKEVSDNQVKHERSDFENWIERLRGFERRVNGAVHEDLMDELTELSRLYWENQQILVRLGISGIIRTLWTDLGTELDVDREAMWSADEAVQDMFA